MLRYECKKLISNKFVLGLFIAVFLLNILLSYSTAKHDAAADIPENVLYALEAYNDNSEVWETEYQRLSTYYNDVFLPAKKEEMKEFFKQNPDSKEYVWELDSDAEKYMDYQNAQAYMAEIDSYPKDLKRVVKAAVIAKEDYLASGVTENDYEYKYQSDIEYIYEVNSLIPIDYEYAVGWDEYHAYTSGNILLVMLMLVLAPGLCIEEFSSGMYPVLHATKKGRLHTFLNKLGALALFTTLAVAVHRHLLGLLWRELRILLPRQLRPSVRGLQVLPRDHHRGRAAGRVGADQDPCTVRLRHPHYAGLGVHQEVRPDLCGLPRRGRGQLRAVLLHFSGTDGLL